MGRRVALHVEIDSLLPEILHGKSHENNRRSWGYRTRPMKLPLQLWRTEEASGGFGLCGTGKFDSNHSCIGREGIDSDLQQLWDRSRGLGILLQSRQISKMISSYVGENKEFSASSSLRIGGIVSSGNPVGADSRGGSRIPAFTHRRLWNPGGRRERNP